MCITLNFLHLPIQFEENKRRTVKEVPSRHIKEIEEGYQGEFINIMMANSY